MVSASLIDTARFVSDHELFPRAIQADISGLVPSQQLDILKSVGLYGLFSPSHVGGAGVDIATQHQVVEILASGCLTTTFCWVQHGGASKAAASSEGPMKDQWADRLASGEARGGVAFAHLVRPGAPTLVAENKSTGWHFSGTAPFVTGWGDIDVVLVAARHENKIVWALVEANETNCIRTRSLSLAALNSTHTVELSFDSLYVDQTQVTQIQEFDSWYLQYQSGLRANGSLGLGVTSRALSLLGPSALDNELIATRSMLDGASVSELPAARGRLGDLCIRSTSALLASRGGSGMIVDQHAQRLAREALFLLVQGQTPEIKKIHVERLTHSNINS
ncbi:MAG: acyl-CoA/acyl-ACP dehydrogenase [Actinomycetota bacterium]|nr:acyl-CoA/acyl-ACP dehydrogenase [Actinomycetota bacterium]